MGTAGEIIILIKYSPKRENLLGKLKDQVECDSGEVIKENAIAKLSETRWTVKVDCFRTCSKIKGAFVTFLPTLL